MKVNGVVKKPRGGEVGWGLFPEEISVVDRVFATIDEEVFAVDTDQGGVGDVGRGDFYLVAGVDRERRAILAADENDFAFAADGFVAPVFYEIVEPGSAAFVVFDVDAGAGVGEAFDAFLLDDQR